MKRAIALATAAVFFSVLRPGAAEDAAADSEGSSAAPRAVQATDLRPPVASGTIAHSPGSTAAVVLVFVMMTVIAYRRLDRTAS